MYDPDVKELRAQSQHMRQAALNSYSVASQAEVEFEGEKIKWKGNESRG